MDFYVWTPNGSSLFRIYRDAEYWDLMKIALSDFWWKHVYPARELYSSNVITHPLFQLRSMRPTPRHELCRDIVYKSKHIAANSKLLMREIHGKLLNSCLQLLEKIHYSRTKLYIIDYMIFEWWVWINIAHE